MILVLCFSGCATYKFSYGKPPYDKGYMVSRDNRAIAEYTIGKDNSVPADIGLAKQRFKRRKGIVEYYYKYMGDIQNNFTKFVWGPIAQFMGGAIIGVFKLPFVIISDYRYDNNPKYREKITRLDEEEEAREKARIEKLKDKLNVYIQQDLAKENP